MESTKQREPWNKSKLVGQKPPLKPKDIWAIRIHLQNEARIRDLAMFNLAIDSKLRGCDLVNLRVRDITHGDQILGRAMVVQRKTQRAVQFEMPAERQALCETPRLIASVVSGQLMQRPGRTKACQIRSVCVSPHDIKLKPLTRFEIR